MKTCTSCGKKKSKPKFSKDRNTPDGLQYRCKECMNAERRENYKKNRKRDIDKAIKYSNDNPDFKKYQDRKYALKKLYGMSLEEYNNLFNKQNGCCAICNMHQSELNKSLHVDHCHDTGSIRGLLCSNCNLMIGNALNEVEILKSGIKYLER